MERKQGKKKIFTFSLISFFVSVAVWFLSVLRCTGQFHVPVVNIEKEGRVKFWDNLDFVTYDMRPPTDNKSQPLPSTSNESILVIQDAKEEPTKRSTYNRILLQQNTLDSIFSTVTRYSWGDTEYEITTEKYSTELFYGKFSYSRKQNLSTNSNSLKAINSNFLGLLTNRSDESFDIIQNRKNITGNRSNYIYNLNNYLDLTNQQMKLASHIYSVEKYSDNFNEQKYLVKESVNKSTRPSKDHYQGLVLSEDDEINKKRLIRQINSWRYPPRIWKNQNFRTINSKISRRYTRFPNKISGNKIRPVSMGPAAAWKNRSPFVNNFYSKITPDNFMKSFNNRINSAQPNKLLQSQNSMPGGDANKIGGECFIFQFLCLLLSEFGRDLPGKSDSDCHCTTQKSNFPFEIHMFPVTESPKRIDYKKLYTRRKKHHKKSRSGHRGDRDTLPPGYENGYYDDYDDDYHEDYVYTTCVEVDDLTTTTEEETTEEQTTEEETTEEETTEEETTEEETTEEETTTTTTTTERTTETTTFDPCLTLTCPEIETTKEGEDYCWPTGDDPFSDRNKNNPHHRHHPRSHTRHKRRTTTLKRRKKKTKKSRRSRKTKKHKKRTTNAKNRPKTTHLATTTRLATTTHLATATHNITKTIHGILKKNITMTTPSHKSSTGYPPDHTGGSDIIPKQKNNSIHPAKINSTKSNSGAKRKAVAKCIDGYENAETNSVEGNFTANFSNSSPFRFRRNDFGLKHQHSNIRARRRKLGEHSNYPWNCLYDCW